MKRETLEIEIKEIIKISEDFGVEKVFLFGSCIDNIEDAKDIDIAVKGITPEQFFKYYGKVSMAVKDEVDIVDMDDLRDHLIGKILSKGKVIYEKKYDELKKDIEDEQIHRMKKFHFLIKILRRVCTNIEILDTVL